MKPVTVPGNLCRLVLSAQLLNVLGPRCTAVKTFVSPSEGTAREAVRGNLDIKSQSGFEASWEAEVQNITEPTRVSVRLRLAPGRANTRPAAEPG